MLKDLFIIIMSFFFLTTERKLWFLLLIHSKYKAPYLLRLMNAAKIVSGCHLFPVTLLFKNPHWPIALDLRT